MWYFYPAYVWFGELYAGMWEAHQVHSFLSWLF